MNIFSREPKPPGPTAPDPQFVEIQLTGVEDLARRGRPPLPGVKLYGHRVSDAAKRLVVVELRMQDAEDIIDHLARTQDFPIIEVPIKSWAYVGVIGAGEAKFKEGT